jgi:hypothetical protein
MIGDPKVGYYQQLIKVNHVEDVGHLQYLLLLRHNYLKKPNK